MRIGDDVIRACKTTAEFRAPLRDLFRAGAYEDVFDSIARFHELARVNRAQARNRLFEDVVAFTSNYVIAPALGAKDALDWEHAFPDLIEQVGAQREDSWRDFLLDRATARREGLREAIDLIVETCKLLQG